MPSRRRSPVWALTGLGGALLLLAILAASTGAMSLSLRTLAGLPFSDGLWQVWLTVRLPRVLLAVVVGCALASSGAVMQGLFRNPLADPGLLGISSGAALAVALTIVMPFSLPPLLALYSHMISAFVGSLAISLIVFTLSRFGHGGLSRLLLAGIAINALCGAAVGVLTYISDDQQLRQFSLWSMGSLGQAQWPTLAVASSLILPACIATFFMSRRLNILQLGEEDAHYLGVNVRRTQLQLLLLSALLVGAAVAVSGVIGFIGLVIPHILRLCGLSDHRVLLPACMLAGASALLGADIIARLALSAAELPIGVVTATLGAPVFIWLLLRSRVRG